MCRHIGTGSFCKKVPTIDIGALSVCELKRMMLHEFPCSLDHTKFSKMTGTDERKNRKNERRRENLSLIDGLEYQAWKGQIAEITIGASGSCSCCTTEAVWTVCRMDRQRQTNSKLIGDVRRSHSRISGSCSYAIFLRNRPHWKDYGCFVSIFLLAPNCSA